MDSIDLTTIGALLIAYGVWYAHANLVRDNVKRPVKEWLDDSAARCAKFGLMFAEGHADESGKPLRTVDCLVTLDGGKKVSVTISEITEESLKN